MKTMFKSMMVAALALVAIACGEDPQQVTPPTPEKSSSIELTVSPASILADGQQEATFTVTLTVKEEGKDAVQSDVTAEADIFCQTTEEVVEGAFTTTVAGDYEFVAMYEELVSEVVKVTATEQANSGLQIEVLPGTDHANVPTPVKWQVGHAIPSDPTAGVEIEVTGTQEKNFQFVCRPGELVQSYRLDVFPVCRLYNSLLETCLGGDATKKADWSTVEDAILDFVFNSTGSGGYIMSPSTQGDEYAEYEYDWMNTQYAQAKVVPWGEYVIVAVGCFDTEGSEPAEMTVCYVSTPGKELVGNPRINIEVEAGYRSFIVTNYPNLDCHYMYYWCSNEDDLMPYINGYGSKQYIDFMRHTLYDAIPADDPEDPNNDPRSYYQNFGQSASSDFAIMATAIALDANETPNTEFDSKVFNLVPIPDLEEGEATMTVIEDRISAHVAWYEVTIDANAHSMLFKIMTPEEAESYKDADEATLKQLALSINNDGWGINNKNYSVDADGNPNGSSYTVRDAWISGPTQYSSLTPGESYVFCWIARNAATELSTPKFTEPFTMKSADYNNPSACESTAQIVVECEDRQKVEVSFTNDSIENTAAAYFQYFIEGFESEDIPSLDADRMTMINYLKGGGSNFWPCEEIGLGGFNFIMEPGMNLTFVCVCEDWNGNFGELQFVEVSTKEAIGGENPEVYVETEYIYGEDNADGSKNIIGCNVYFSANEDTEYMKHMSAGVETPGLALDYLGDTSVASGAEMYAQWKLYCGEYGLQTNSLTVSTPHVLVGSVDEPMVAMGLAYGRDASGNSVISDLKYVIFDGESVKTLKDYYPSYTGLSAPKPYSYAMPEIPARAQSVVYASQMTAPAAVKAEPKEIVEQGKAIKYIWLDMKALGSHPKAKMQ